VNDKNYIKYKEIREKVENCYSDNVINESQYNGFIKELNTLFPYVNYNALYDIKIDGRIIENKLNIINEKIKKIILDKRRFNS
jgi:hypothetical protein